jgi:hypothetical protein
MSPPIPKPLAGDAYRFLAIAFANASCIPLLVRLGVFDGPPRGVKHLDEIAKRTGLDAAVLARVLLVCRCAGLITDVRDGRFSLTDHGQLLAPDEPEGAAREAAMRAARTYRERWDALESILRGGARTAAGIEVEELDRANVAETHRAVLADCAAAFSRSETYVDVESGDPALLAAVLQRSARSEGVFVGKAAELERARRVLSEARVAQRCAFVVAESAATLPPGDAYIVSHRLEALGDDQADALLARARRAMKPNGRVLLIERVLRNQFDQLDAGAVATDLEMLLLTPAGKLRTQEELEALCTRASLTPKPPVYVGTRRGLSGETHRAQVIQAAP